jgi:hypothetical protein
LQFCDERDLVLENSELRAKLELVSKKQAGSLLRDAEHLRDRLAHSNDDLVQGSSWMELVELIERIEALVNRSDDLVERDAKSGARGMDALTVAG